LIGTRNKEKTYLKKFEAQAQLARTKKIQLQNVSFWSILMNGNQAIMKRAYVNDEAKRMTASSESMPNSLEEAKKKLYWQRNALINLSFDPNTDTSSFARHSLALKI
jgi:hypothetical protein